MIFFLLLQHRQQILISVTTSLARWEVLASQVTCRVEHISAFVDLDGVVQTVQFSFHQVCMFVCVCLFVCLLGCLFVCLLVFCLFFICYVLFVAFVLGLFVWSKTCFKLHVMIMMYSIKGPYADHILIPEGSTGSSIIFDIKWKPIFFWLQIQHFSLKFFVVLEI